MPDSRSAPQRDTTVTVINGADLGPVEPTEPAATCSYCLNRIYTPIDHASNCCWRRGEAPAR